MAPNPITAVEKLMLQVFIFLFLALVLLPDIHDYNFAFLQSSGVENFVKYAEF